MDDAEENKALEEAFDEVEDMDALSDASEEANETDSDGMDTDIEDNNVRRRKAWHIRKKHDVKESERARLAAVKEVSRQKQKNNTMARMLKEMTEKFEAERREKEALKKQLEQQKRLKSREKKRVVYRCFS